MSNLGSMLDIGRMALLAAQSQIAVTSSNIANSGTVGYTRKSVNLASTVMDTSAIGQVGTGVTATEIMRSFDEMIEKLYNEKSSDASRWSAAYTNLSNIETLFTESDTTGISSSLTAFWGAWQTLSSNPSDSSARSALLSTTSILTTSLNNLHSDISNIKTQLDSYISQDVDNVNTICREIVKINQQLNTQTAQGSSSTLLDQRDGLVRNLAEILDINYIDGEGGNITITTKAGQTLVSGTQYPTGNTDVLTYEPPKAYSALTSGSSFDGQVYFTGSSGNEYTLEVVEGGSVTGDDTAAVFKVSLDGGKTWLTSASGGIHYFSARPEDQSVQVGDLTIWFGQKNAEGSAPTTPLSVGDKFTIVPKSGVYWHETTASSVNITTQILADGSEDTSRIVGGSLAGYLQTRDEYIGNYEEKLDAFTKELIWNVNRLHSQGAGLTPMSSVTGSYSVADPDYALGADYSGLSYGSKLTAGNMSMYVYDSDGKLLNGGALDFDPTTDGIQNFDPATHSLTDVVNAINNTYGSYLTASVASNKLVINSKSGYNFAFGNDTAGLSAALGVNTFFDGDSASNISTNSSVKNNLNYINVGHVNGNGEINSGDTTTASALTALQNATITFHTSFEGYTTQTLGEYYGSLVTKVGADAAVAEFNSTYHTALATDLNNKQQEVSGVNLDEEMANLIKFQHAYTAAAKLITTSDQMMNILLSLKN